MSDNKLLLEWNQSNIYSSDMQILQSSTQWLNDRIITFAYDYLQYRIYHPTTTSSSSSSSSSSSCMFHFLSPLTSYLLLHETDQHDLQDAVDSIEIRCTASSHDTTSSSLPSLPLPLHEFLFLPINDNSHVTSVGGTHWSLLVVHMIIQHHSNDDDDNHNTDNIYIRYYHFDSMKGSANSHYAHTLAQKLHSLLLHTHNNNDKTSTMSRSTKSHGKNSNDVKVNEMNCSQQHNSYDCGLYVIAYAESIAKYMTMMTQHQHQEQQGNESNDGASHNRLDLISTEATEWINKEVTSKYVAELRKRIIQQIHDIEAIMKVQR